MSETQQTLSGGSIDFEYQRPDTFSVCYECDEAFLRSRWHEHADHMNYVPYRKWHRRSDDENNEDDEDDDEPIEIGGVFSVDLSYSVDYHLNVTATDERRAKEKAKELAWDLSPNDMMHMHTSIRKEQTIYEDDDEAEELEW